MKNGIIFLFVVSLIFLFLNQEEEIIIPDEAIRLRVIANSNTLEDQMQKMIIKDEIEEKIYELIQGVNNVSEVRSIIQDNLPVIEEIVREYQVSFQIDYGKHYFPVKNYKGILYPAGNYESLVVTLGEGVGNNFWCVLFPPLCLVENSHEDVSDVEYKLYVKKLLEQF